VLARSHSDVSPYPQPGRVSLSETSDVSHHPPILIQEGCPCPGYRTFLITPLSSSRKGVLVRDRTFFPLSKSEGRGPSPSSVKIRGEGIIPLPCPNPGGGTHPSPLSNEVISFLCLVCFYALRDFLTRLCSSPLKLIRKCPQKLMSSEMLTGFYVLNIQ